jgi:hypothetical protein
MSSSTSKPGARRIACLLLGVAFLAGCERAPQLSPQAIATRDAPPERMFKGTLAGQPAHFVVDACEVFRVRHMRGDEVEWTSVLAPEPYPFFTGCERQSLSFDAAEGVLTATLGRRAFGAGGCCATGGTYRTTDGLVWKRTGH